MYALGSLWAAQRSARLREIISGEVTVLRCARVKLFYFVGTNSPNQLAVELEKDREEIADLQERVKRLVARRANKVPESKKEAEELQRGVETLAQATAAVDLKK